MIASLLIMLWWKPRSFLFLSTFHLLSIVSNYIIYILILINLTIIHISIITSNRCVVSTGDVCSWIGNLRSWRGFLTCSQDRSPLLTQRRLPQRRPSTGPQPQRSPNRILSRSKIIKILTSTCINLISWSHTIAVKSYSLYLFIRTNSLRIRFFIIWIAIISSSVISWSHLSIVLPALNFIIDTGNGNLFLMLGISFGLHSLCAGIRTASLVAWYY